MGGQFDIGIGLAQSPQRGWPRSISIVRSPSVRVCQVDDGAHVAEAIPEPISENRLDDPFGPLCVSRRISCSPFVAETFITAPLTL